jgi:hypothetical protein
LKGEVRMCPRCGSAGVDYGQISGSEAHCRGCQWRGTREDLLLLAVNHEFLSDESMALAMVNDMRQLLSGELGLPYLKFLIKWGFVKADVLSPGNTVDRKQFAAYLAAIVTGVLTSILKCRVDLETAGKEPIDGRSGN